MKEQTNMHIYLLIRSYHSVRLTIAYCYSVANVQQLTVGQLLFAKWHQKTRRA